jgi:hypothetical protein
MADPALWAARIMTKDQIQTAIEEGIPFLIRMADGEKLEVSDRYQIALGRTAVVVVGKDDMPHILPLLTMTGISYLKAKH